MLGLDDFGFRTLLQFFWPMSMSMSIATAIALALGSGNLRVGPFRGFGNLVLWAGAIDVRAWFGHGLGRPRVLLSSVASRSVRQDP